MKEHEAKGNDTDVQRAGGVEERQKRIDGPHDGIGPSSGASMGGFDRVDYDVSQRHIMDDIFTEADVVRPTFQADLDAYLRRLWEANPRIHEILSSSSDVEEARERLYDYLNEEEKKVFLVENEMYVMEKTIVRDCIRTFRSILGPINEKRAGVSALEHLWKLARRKEGEGGKAEVSPGFLEEFINLFRGVRGESFVYKGVGGQGIRRPDFLSLKGRDSAVARTASLDEFGHIIRQFFRKYPSGLDDEVIEWRQENKRRIMEYFGADEEQWNDYVWQLTHVIKKAAPLKDLLELTREQRKAVEKAEEYGIPFGITPYYLSLMDEKVSLGYDHAVRAQVIPPLDYVENLAAHREDRREFFDFMGEHDTSPVDLVTRRYPLIAILKPFNTCAQICVYCQRNWEIDECMSARAMASRSRLEEALDWLASHKALGDILVTGGDPLVMKDEMIEYVLDRLASMKHVYRIRIGSRTPVVLPQRFTRRLLDILERYHEPGRREIVLVTHFEHSYEITPEAAEAVASVRRLGIGVYNQAVFTIENSRRFELAKLRRDLRLIGVDPYYTFNMKGKAETRRYMVPIARLLQERKEEARLLPGIDRTDEPVFNVPKLGKNHLRAWQDHRVIMIRPDGCRVYEFHPWEKNIAAVPPYYYVDVPIYEYLEELASRGENIHDYKTIWYYF